jgi:hypothetical protein
MAFAFSAVTLPSSNSWTTAFHNDNVFCVTGDITSDGNAYTSPTGEDGTWAIAGFIDFQDWRGGTGFGSRLCIVGIDAVSYSADNGATWAAGVIPAGTWNAVANNGSRLVAVSTGAGVAKFSDDFGATWSASGLASDDWQDIKHDGTNFIAVSSTGKIAYSPTGGASWSVLTPITFRQWYCIAIQQATHTIFVGGYDSLGNQAAGMVSTDGGASWAGTVSPGGFSLTKLVSAAACNDRFVAVGDGTVSDYGDSTDGLTWTGHALPGGLTHQFAFQVANAADGARHTLILPEYFSDYMLFGFAPSDNTSPYFHFSFP